ncbi:hypothetical protein A3D09_04190 [Candidatus Collierbacteria bacterium RIFCSPHIGHO2_02_FULL_49_10]|uniref:Glycosyltransferase RgtA/B/C/D-like domain-containing protein n=1 Tax=Candidatus Collierbacteria bacterium RIFCSPHIGHO2_02_FULL_49_10 TaxID=1817723 RepID=A0A1F5ETX5_9BACT|nr:MAG: hypothetical protein A3D09_04190 [Candidatus Collierbacteria bacterium RIFCSPHIGHO2_02_FULL_49_10]
MAKTLVRLNFAILIALIVVNLLGAFMPELSFDALWYHLTLSKLFLLKGQWYFPGGLFYYSPMPRLVELIGMPLLAQFGYVGPKLVEFFSGLAICILIYRLAKRFTGNVLLAFTAVNLFYATWLVSWLSSATYVDLIRTVFELCAFALLAGETLTTRHKLLAGVFLGLAIGVKWHALGSLLLLSLIFSPLVIPTALLVASPWFFIAYHFTGNPVFPLFEKFMQQTQLAQVGAHYYAPLAIFSRFFFAPIFLTKPSEDFLSPVAGIVYLLAVPCLLSANKIIRKIALFGILGTFLLQLTPPPSTRYFLSYLPALIIAAVYFLSRLKRVITLWIIGVFTLSALLILGMRLSAFAKFFPYLTGKLSENRFLASQSARLPDTFIDADDYVKNNLPSDASYVISNNLHNLFYFPYNFDHESFVDNSRRYDYLITKNTPAEEVDGDLIHINPVGIQIYKL